MNNPTNNPFDIFNEVDADAEEEINKTQSNSF